MSGPCTEYYTFPRVSPFISDPSPPSIRLSTGPAHQHVVTFWLILHDPIHSNLLILYILIADKLPGWIWCLMSGTMWYKGGNRFEAQTSMGSSVLCRHLYQSSAKISLVNQFYSIVQCPMDLNGQNSRSSPSIRTLLSHLLVTPNQALA